MADARSRQTFDYSCDSDVCTGDYNNIAMAAPNIPSVTIPTTIRDSHELGCPCISLRSDAAIKIPTSKNSANTPLITAVQQRFYRIHAEKIYEMPSNIEVTNTALK